MHGKEKVVGMVIVDSLAMMKELPLGWMSLLGDSSYKKVIGLEEIHVLSDEEWE